MWWRTCWLYNFFAYLRATCARSDGNLSVFEWGAFCWLNLRQSQFCHLGLIAKKKWTGNSCLIAVLQIFSQSATLIKSEDVYQTWLFRCVWRVQFQSWCTREWEERERELTRSPELLKFGQLMNSRLLLPSSSPPLFQSISLKILTEPTSSSLICIADWSLHHDNDNNDDGPFSLCPRLICWLFAYFPLTIRGKEGEGGWWERESHRIANDTM